MSARLVELIGSILTIGPSTESVDEFEKCLDEETNLFVKRKAASTLVSSLVIHSFDLHRAERLCRKLIEEKSEPELFDVLATIYKLQGREDEAIALREQAKQGRKNLLGI